MKKLSLYGFLVDLLILIVLLVSIWQGKPVQAQLAGSSGFKYTPITTATNTQVASAGGTLHNIVVNGGTLGTLTIVDTSAANCTGGTTIGTTATVVAGQVYVYDLQYNNGLCITTSAATNLTVMTR